MVLGIGVDMVELERIGGVLERHGGAFRARVFTATEQAAGESRGRATVAYYAGRWAAKEAVAKALGTGFGRDCGWLDIEIGNDALGKPSVTLHGAALARAGRLGISRWHLSITHERQMACAFVVAEGDGPTGTS